MSVLLLPVLVLAVLIVLNPMTVRAQGQAIVIVVDGVSFTNILLVSDPDLPEHYLEGALWEIIEEYKIKGIDREDLISLDWYPQDPLIATGPAIEALAGILARESKRAQEEDKKLILVAHSWGTFLANAALGYATNEQPEGGPEFDRMGPLDLFIAMGSPLGHQQVSFNPTEYLLTSFVDHVKNLVQEERGLVQVPKGIQSIVNYWAWGDIISGPLSNTAWLAGLVVDDHIVDLEMEGYEQFLLRRNSANTVVWHYYDSLMSGGFINNDKLRRAVAEEITEALGEPE